MKRIWKDKRGSSLVLVIICMTFLILLAGAVITMTVTNIRLKATQKKTQENFYSTDSALDEISAGIRNLSSEASAQAYESAMSLYDASMTVANASIDAKYESDFLDIMLKALGSSTGVVDGTTDYQFKDKILDDFLTDEEKTDQVYQYHTDTRDDTSVGTMKLDGSSIILKDITVVKLLKSDDSYETTLTTDIRIEVPSVTTEAHSEYLSYCILADDQIRVTNSLSGVSINGNIYSGTVNRDKENTDESKAGIVIDKSDVTINAANIITRGDLSVTNGANVGIASDGVKSYAEFWAENILTDGSNSALTLNARTFVADDLELNGKNNKVTLKGWYYGYNFTDNYSDSNVTSSGKLSKLAQYSSSISVNGKSDRLNMSGLQNLILAGRTFISKKTTNNVVENDSTGNPITNPDVELGESLAVRSAQLSYLVGAQKENDSTGYVKSLSSVDAYEAPAGAYGYGNYTNGSKQIRCYFFTIDGTQYLFDYQAYISHLGLGDGTNPLELTGTDYTNYEWDYITKDWLEEGKPLALYYRPATSGTQDIRYFYLNFANSNDGRKAARKFYDVFFNQSTQQQFYDEINKSYLDGYGIVLNDSADVMLSSGNLMYGNNTDVDGVKVKMENDSIDPTANFIDYATTKSKTYMSLQMALIDNYSDALTSSKWRLYDDYDANSDGKLTKSGRSDGTNLFDVLVDRTKLPTTTQIGSYEVEKTSASGGKVKCAYIVSGSDTTIEWPTTYTSVGNTLDSEGYAIIVAAGDVKIKTNNFHGMIISGGDVSIDVASSVYSDEEVITNAFEADKNGDQAFYDVLSKYFRKSVDATISGSSETAGAEANVTYENWKKND